jgi:hypothetical protein
LSILHNKVALGSENSNVLRRDVSAENLAILSLVGKRDIVMSHFFQCSF